MSTNMLTLMPPEILEEFERDAKAAGFPSRRIDAPRSRWKYFRKLLALGRQYADVLSRD
jgi:hypothetical protein